MKLLRYVLISPAGNPQWSLKAASAEAAWRRLEQAQGTRLRDELRRDGWSVEPRQPAISPNAVPVAGCSGGGRTPHPDSRRGGER